MSAESFHFHNDGSPDHSTPIIQSCCCQKLMQLVQQAAYYFDWIGVNFGFPAS